MLQYFGLDHSMISAASERNADKWGMVTVGTRIPIVSEAEARTAKPDYFLVLPWHFIEEFKAREHEYLSTTGKFIVPCPHFELVCISAVRFRATLIVAAAEVSACSRTLAHRSTPERTTHHRTAPHSTRETRSLQVGGVRSNSHAVARLRSRPRRRNPWPNSILTRVHPLRAAPHSR